MKIGAGRSCKSPDNHIELANHIEAQERAGRSWRSSRLRKCIHVGRRSATTHSRRCRQNTNTPCALQADALRTAGDAQESCTRSGNRAARGATTELAMWWVVAASSSMRPTPLGSRRGRHHRPPTALVALLCAGGPGPTSHHGHHQPSPMLVGDGSHLPSSPNKDKAGAISISSQVLTRMFRQG